MGLARHVMGLAEHTNGSSPTYHAKVTKISNITEPSGQALVPSTHEYSKETHLNPLIIK